MSDCEAEENIEDVHCQQRSRTLWATLSSSFHQLCKRKPFSFCWTSLHFKLENVDLSWLQRQFFLLVQKHCWCHFVSLLVPYGAYQNTVSDLLISSVTTENPLLMTVLPAGWRLWVRMISSQDSRSIHNDQIRVQQRLWDVVDEHPDVGCPSSHCH